MGNSVGSLHERKNNPMSEIATMWHTCQPKKFLEFQTVKAAGKDVADLKIRFSEWQEINLISGQN